MSEFKKLTDEELKKVTGGFNWESYCQCILLNGGDAIPELSELVEAIKKSDLPKVAILTLASDIETMPLVLKCQAISQHA